MIAEKIQAAMKQIKEVEHFVNPGVWKMLRPAVEELADAAESAQALENAPMVLGDLTLVNFVSVKGGQSEVKITPPSIAELLMGKEAAKGICPVKKSFGTFTKYLEPKNNGG